MNEMSEQEERELVREIVESNEAWQTDTGIVEIPVTNEMRQNLYQGFIDTLPKERREKGQSRTGITKKVHHEKAEKKAVKKAKKQRAINQSRKNKKRRATGSKQRK